MKTEFVTRQPAFLETLRLLEYAARETSDPILLVGPVGVGKSTLVRSFGTGKGPFFEFNCAAEPALEFPDQISGKSHATIFLREIEALTPEAQAKVLDLLDTEPQMRVWASVTEKSTNETPVLRPDLRAALSVWTFKIPALAQRSEDFPELVEQEIDFRSKSTKKRAVFTEEAHAKFLRFAESPEAVWTANFRDLRASVSRMAGLAFRESAEGRISMEIVSAEIARLKSLWTGQPPVIRVPENLEHQAELLAQKILGTEHWNALDRFDRLQLADVLWVCAQSQNFSEAGRVLFSASRLEKKTSNDSDRMRKYLLKFGITWNDIQSKKEETE